jgi:hypothetical protein
MGARNGAGPTKGRSRNIGEYLYAITRTMGRMKGGKVLSMGHRGEWQ